MKICQTVSDRPKIMEKFSQLADENGHVLLPGSTTVCGVTKDIAIKTRVLSTETVKCLVVNKGEF